MARKALLIGINKYEQSPLAGCVNDVLAMRDILIAQYQLQPSAIRILAEADATSAGIRAEIGQLLTGISASDQLLLYFAGHGTQKGYNAVGEEDGRDEAIVPVDMSYSTLITDNDLFDLIAPRVAEAGAHFSAVYDCCHSGTMVRDVEIEGDDINIVSNRCIFIPLPVELKIRSLALGPFNVLSACQDAETAADLKINGMPRGAFSYALQSILAQNPDILLGQLDSKVLEVIKRVSPKHVQNPNYTITDKPSTKLF